MDDAALIAENRAFISALGWGDRLRALSPALGRLLWRAYRRLMSMWGGLMLWVATVWQGGAHMGLAAQALGLGSSGWARAAGFAAYGAMVHALGLLALMALIALANMERAKSFVRFVSDAMLLLAFSGPEARSAFERGRIAASAHAMPGRGRARRL